MQPVTPLIFLDLLDPNLAARLPLGQEVVITASIVALAIASLLEQVCDRRAGGV